MPNTNFPWHTIGQLSAGGYGLAQNIGGTTGDPTTDGTNGTPRMSNETRGINTAYVPRVHI